MCPTGRQPDELILGEQFKPAVDLLTSTRPPLVGREAGTVEHEFLSLWIVRGCSLQPSNERPVAKFGLRIRSDNLQLPGSVHPLRLLLQSTLADQRAQKHVEMQAHGIARWSAPRSHSSQYGALIVQRMNEDLASYANIHTYWSEYSKGPFPSACHC